MSSSSVLQAADCWCAGYQVFHCTIQMRITRIHVFVESLTVSLKWPSMCMFNVIEFDPYNCLTGLQNYIKSASAKPTS